MFSNTSSSRKIDRRIQRTRERLGNALVALIQEKTFDSITVQNVLDRAAVGRATFYQHYRDKNDLFISVIDEFLERMATMLSRIEEASNRVAPVRELFAHVAAERRLYTAVCVSGRLPDLLELAQGHFARAIEQRLQNMPRTRLGKQKQKAALPQALAGALLSLMSWWIDRGMPGSATEMDGLFHAMTTGGLTSLDN